MSPARQSRKFSERLRTLDLNDPQLNRDRNGLLLANGGLTNVASIVMAALILYPFYQPADMYLHLGWGALMCILVLARITLAFLFARNTGAGRSLRSLKALFTSCTILLAVTCGASAMIFFPGASLPEQLFLCFIIGGYCAIAVSSLTPSFYTGISFVLLSLLPFASGLFYMPGSLGYAPGVAMSCLILAMCIFAKQNNRYLFSLIVIDHEHNKLNRDLTVSKRDNEEKSRKLNSKITNQRKVEEELRHAIIEAENAIKIKAEFLATMSHEIRTPMNGVLGMTELLMNTELSSKQKRYSEAIHQSGEALLTIINDVLDFSKIEAGKFELRKEPFDLRQLIEDTCALLAERAEQQSVDLICMYPVNCHTAFNSDRNRIRQILTNLIGNAIKFTKQGEVFVNVKFEKENEEHATIYVEVKDNGIGVKEEVADQIFDSFTQADGSMTRRFGGTGLGLAICKKLIELMNGEIGMQSEYGKGSTFWFKLTLTKDSLSNVRNSEVLKSGNIKDARILMVDDNDTSRNIMEQQIRGWHAHFDGAKNGKQALHKLYLAEESGKPFDIAIFDKQLPQMDSIRLTKKIRVDEKLKDTKVIILSAVGQLEETGEWMVAGVQAHLNKPLRQTELFNCLVSVYNQNQPQIQATVKNEPDDTKKENEKLSGYVLVAEDNLINQELITQMLESFACRFRFVYDGKEALEAITDSPMDQRNDPYDMILMDCQMPEMDGFEATQAIRKWEKFQQCAPIPIVALTANAMQGDREKCLDAGMDDYLSKPFTSDQLFTLLKKWLPISVIEAKETPVIKTGTPPADATHVSTLDRAAIARIKKLQREDAADVLLKIIGIYLQKGPELMQEISQAISTGDADKLRHAAHSLKSSSASLGANDMASLCSELENMGRDGDLTNALGKLDFLEFEFEGVCQALHHESEQQAA